MSVPTAIDAHACEWCERDCPRCGYPIDAGWRHVDVPQADGAGIIVCSAGRVVGPLVEALSGFLAHRRDHREADPRGCPAKYGGQS